MPVLSTTVLECGIPRFLVAMYWKIQLEWWMTRAALHESRVMHKIQYTMSAKHELCIGFYALQVMSAMQLESWIMSVVFFNILWPKILECHYYIKIGMNKHHFSKNFKPFQSFSLYLITDICNGHYIAAAMYWPLHSSCYVLTIT